MPWRNVDDDPAAFRILATVHDPIANDAFPVQRADVTPQFPRLWLVEQQLQRVHGVAGDAVAQFVERIDSDPETGAVLALQNADVFLSQSPVRQRLVVGTRGTQEGRVFARH